MPYSIERIFFSAAELTMASDVVRPYVREIAHYLDIPRGYLGFQELDAVEVANLTNILIIGLGIGAIGIQHDDEFHA